MPGVAPFAQTTGLRLTRGWALAPSRGGGSGANRFASKPVQWLSLLMSFFAALFFGSLAHGNDTCDPAPPLAALCFDELEQDFDMVGALPTFELSFGDRQYAATIEIADQTQPGSSARLEHDLAATLLKEKTGETYDFDAVAFVKANMRKYPKRYAEGVIRDGKTLSLEPSEVDGVAAYTATREKRVWTDKRSGIRTAFAVDTTMIMISTVREGFDPDAHDKAVHEAVLRTIKVNE